MAIALMKNPPSTKVNFFCGRRQKKTFFFLDFGKVLVFLPVAAFVLAPVRSVCNCKNNVLCQSHAYILLFYNARNKRHKPKNDEHKLEGKMIFTTAEEIFYVI